jgi:glycosyltransferase involved in cell wall biosynthesis
MTKSADEKRKIFYIITKSNFGGAQRYVYDLAVKMKENGSDVTVVLGGGGALKLRLEESYIKTIAVKEFGRDVKIFRDFIVLVKLFKIFRTERPDIIHLNSSKIGGLGSFAGRLARVKRIIFTAHGWAFKEERNALSIAMIRFLSWLTLFLAHKTIVVSKDDLENTPRLFVKRKIVTIRNGISNISYKDKNAARQFLRKKIGGAIPQRAVWIGTISELHRNKGLKYAIQAIINIIQEGRNVIFAIIGDGEERQTLQHLIKEHGIEKRIFLVGQIDNAATLLPAFDIFTIPSVKEGLPYTLLEAGLAGLPTVATIAGGIPEVIDDMESGILVRPQNSKELEKALIYLLENSEKRAMFGNNLQEKVKKGFTIDRMMQETSKVYQLDS